MNRACEVSDREEMMVGRQNQDRIEVEINDTQGHMRVDRAALIDLSRFVLSREGRLCASVSIALVDNATIRLINRTHLGHDWPTDVISFPLSAPEDPVLAGELVVSAEIAGTSAREFGVEPWNELALYVVHGLLHLCGYDDSSEPDAWMMRRQEQEFLTGAGLGGPFLRVGGPEASWDLEESEFSHWSS
jgi:probable rRNA maturation factor